MRSARRGSTVFCLKSYPRLDNKHRQGSWAHNKVYTCGHVKEHSRTYIVMKCIINVINIRDG